MHAGGWSCILMLFVSDGEEVKEAWRNGVGRWLMFSHHALPFSEHSSIIYARKVQLLLEISISAVIRPHATLFYIRPASGSSTEQGEANKHPLPPDTMVLSLCKPPFIVFQNSSLIFLFGISITHVSFERRCLSGNPTFSRAELNDSEGAHMPILLQQIERLACTPKYITTIYRPPLGPQML
jgi:hypothetical protein